MLKATAKYQAVVLCSGNYIIQFIRPMLQLLVFLRIDQSF